ncbi:WG repeat-containing protein [Chryseobacterium paridis]|uniref:WG repeat-containing protein n=1 Tax=Chryseobacterium paridis TaxID=2800328 RepID=A0ABS1FYQ1_9FLAO|nr:WG repeat-containing protein [Chryseobacterium paridis]MBK1897579.1 WG repeat-containing protein [Chryseobacterium paridis]
MKVLHVNFKYLAVFLLFISCKIFSQELDYIPYRRGKMWGLCDSSKRIIVQPQYYSISSYDHSVGGFHAEQNGKFGIIDKNGIQIMPFISEGTPIIIQGENYIVFDGWDRYYYSVKTKMKLDKYIESARAPIGDSWGGSRLQEGKQKEVKMSWEDLDDEDLTMLKPYDNEDTYFLDFKRNFIEIQAKDNFVGIYIPQIKKIFLNTTEVAHVGWQFYNKKPYVFTTNSTHLFGLVDENSKEVYPIKYHSIALFDGYRLVVLSEPDPTNPNSLLYKTILPNSKLLDGQYNVGEEIFKNGYPFQLYYKIVDGQKNYAGEDGTLYFEG